MRHAARTDDNQAEIVKALRAVGVSVCYIKWPLDLLCSTPKKTALIEVKDAGGKLTKDQIEFIASWQGELHICQTPEQAIKAMIGEY